MNIATIAALAVTLGLPAPAQQSATKIITENGQPALALDEQFAARLRDGGMKQGSPATVPAEFSAAAPGLPLPADANHAAVRETAGERNRRMEWWRDAKFGMFIHYGLYSGLSGNGKAGPEVPNGFKKTWKWIRIPTPRKLCPCSSPGKA